MTNHDYATAAMMIDQVKKKTKSSVFDSSSECIGLTHITSSKE